MNKLIMRVDGGGEIVDLEKDFDMEEGGYANAAIPSSGLSRQMNKQPDEIMELLWENGQVVVHSQNQQRLPRKSPPPNSSQHLPIMPPPHHSNGDTATHLFIQEDEMASWLHYPLDDSSLDRDLYTDFLYQHPPAAPTASRGAEIRPNLPQPLPHQPDQAPSRSPTLPPPHPPLTATTPPGANNFPLFSKMRVTNRFQQDPAGPSTSSKQNNNNHNHGRPNDVRERETTVVDSSDTPVVTGISNRIPHLTATTRSSAVEVSGSGWSFDCRDTNTGGGDGGIGDTTGGCPSVSRDGETCELTLTSSPGGSGASASATATTDRGNHQPVDDRKRKAREAAAADDGNGDYHSEDIEIESAELRKQSRGSTANKRSRAAEVHNLSERRRRDRINEKMKALQELIPRCSKTDKASMLDEAIEYLKSLQMQVQMMSMGCGMIPMMFSQQYMPSPMGMGMSMGMGLEMGMNRPMMPFPAMLSQTPGAASHMGPRFQLPTFPLPPHHVPTAANMSRMQQVAVGQADHMTINHPLGLSSHHHQPNLPTAIPNMGDAYQQYMSMQQQMQVQNSQNQPPPQPSSTKPNKNRGGDG